jgi:lipoyl(octanoyl) transferase
MTVDWDSFAEETLTTAEVRLLGRVDVPSVLALQKLMVHEVQRQGTVSAAVLLCEHPPTVTTGTDSNLLELPVDRRELEARLLTVHRLKRDGHTILHLPGQLAVYVVVSLQECGFGEAEFRWRLQEAIIRTAADSQVSGHRSPDDATGVWARHGLICEIGVKIEKGITSFGAFLNVNNRLDESGLTGRGLRGERISSLSAERVRPAIIPQVRSALIQHICEQMGYPEYHIHTGHPFLTRTRKFVHDKFADH